MKRINAEYTAIIFSALTFASGIISAIEFSDDVFGSIQAFNSALVEGGSNAELVPTELLSFIETVAVFGVPTLVMSATVLRATYGAITKKNS